MTTQLAVKPLISIVAPAFNEQDCIADFVADVERHLSPLAVAFELIVVDDGSTDQTAEILDRVAAAMPALRPIFLDRNHGQSAALAAGVSQCRGEFIALTDADLQNVPADIRRMLETLRANGHYACIVGVRARREDCWLRRTSSRIANWCAARITGDWVRDAGCGLKLFREDVLRRIAFFRGAHRFLATLVRMQGGVVTEMEVNHRPRLKGRSKYGSGLGRAFVALRDALGVRWLMDRHLRFEIRGEARRT